MCVITTNGHLNRALSPYCLCVPPVERVGEDKEYLCTLAPRSQERRLVPVLGPKMLKGDFLNPHSIAVDQNNDSSSAIQTTFPGRAPSGPKQGGNRMGSPSRGRLALANYLLLLRHNHPVQFDLCHSLVSQEKGHPGRIYCFRVHTHSRGHVSGIHGYNMMLKNLILEESGTIHMPTLWQDFSTLGESYLLKDWRY